MSDVDVVIRVKEPDLFMLAGTKNDLEVRLRRSVDIVTYTENLKNLDKISEGELFVERYDNGKN